MAPSDQPESVPTTAAVPARLQSFAELLHAAHTGCPEATQTVVVHYSAFVLRTVRSYLKRDHELRDKYESPDLTQETWRKVLVALGRGQMPTVPEHFVRFLIRVVRTTFLRMYRDFITRQKRCLLREEPLNLLCHDRPATGEAGVDPADQALANDEWARSIQGFPDDERGVLWAIRDGERASEVADRFDISTRTVERIVKQLKLKLIDSDVSLTERWFAWRKRGDRKDA